MIEEEKIKLKAEAFDLLRQKELVVNEINQRLQRIYSRLGELEGETNGSKKETQ